MAKMTPPDPIMQELERLENYPPAGEEPDEVFYITAIQYCEACHAVVGNFIFHIWFGLFCALGCLMLLYAGIRMHVVCLNRGILSSSLCHD